MYYTKIIKGTSQEAAPVLG